MPSADRTSRRSSPGRDRSVNLVAERRVRPQKQLEVEPDRGRLDTDAGTTDLTVEPGWCDGQVLTLERLSRRFGDVTALDDLSFTVPPGQVMGFLGPNGAGKTTTMRAILGLTEPDHITHDETRQGVQQLYSQAEVTAGDIAEVIGFVVSRPRHLAINEILLRPAGQL